MDLIGLLSLASRTFYGRCDSYFPRRLIRGYATGFAATMAASMDTVFGVKLLQALRDSDPALIHLFLALAGSSPGTRTSSAPSKTRSFLNATFRSQLHSYIQAPLITPLVSPPGLVDLLESPRANFIDLSYFDNDSSRCCTKPHAENASVLSSTTINTTTSSTSSPES